MLAPFAFDAVPVAQLHELVRQPVAPVSTLGAEDANVVKDVADGFTAYAVLLAQLCDGDPVTAADCLYGPRLPTEDLLRVLQRFLPCVLLMMFFDQVRTWVM
ncbi:MAG: hypothetical protein JWM36_2751 [Hyphomicrobiales bacterium]|nr:hypothetical protein [Hyphomicrobiales bacterium]